MTDAELMAIEERWKKATSGTWITTANPDSAETPWGWNEVIAVGDYDDPDARLDHIVQTDELDDRSEDLIFIAEAHQDVPALLAEVRRLRDEVKQAKAECNAVRLTEARYRQAYQAFERMLTHDYGLDAQDVAAWLHSLDGAS